MTNKHVGYAYLRLDENLKARWAGYADAKVEETRAPEMSWFY